MNWRHFIALVCAGAVLLIGVFALVGGAKWFSWYMIFNCRPLPMATGAAIEFSLIGFVLVYLVVREHS